MLDYTDTEQMCKNIHQRNTDRITAESLVREAQREGQLLLCSKVPFYLSIGLLPSLCQRGRILCAFYGLF